MFAKRGEKHSKKKTYNNRLLYSLIALGVLVAVAIGVYATEATGAIPNPGHAISELQSCGTAGQILEVGSDGNWSCVSSSSGTPTVTCSNGQVLTYNSTGWHCTSLGSKGPEIYIDHNTGDLTNSSTYTYTYTTSANPFNNLWYCNCDYTSCYESAPQTCTGTGDNIAVGYLVN